MPRGGTKKQNKNETQTKVRMALQAIAVLCAPVCVCVRVWRTWAPHGCDYRRISECRFVSRDAG